MNMPSGDFWRGKRVLVTGHTGFKGSWLCCWLLQLGANVTGIALPPCTSPALFEALGLDARMPSVLSDIRKPQSLAEQIADIQPEVVFHLAAQSLVRPSYESPLETFETNIMGTANILEALRHCKSVRAVVVVTTDKVYQNPEDGRAFAEDDSLGGHDPYSASKAACEIVVESYRRSFLQHNGIALASARAGNVIGGGDWSVDRLLPDAIKAWQQSKPVFIRNPASVRPWQHVLDPLAGYLTLAQALYHHPDLAMAYNFGPEADDAIPVGELMGLAVQHWPGADVVVQVQLNAPHEAALLRLNASRATQVLEWQPRWRVTQAVMRSMDWYLGFYAGKDAWELCCADIRAYGEAK
ncbi:CDP-glucose 4,6-dehydratase [Aeromonas enteropelogenes]|uniref:CDP-glucose 4,6-dehydratase n=1 Tax=Aeromonas enteropelogenes TaxID=29489 RepID=UPI003BA3BB5E